MFNDLFGELRSACAAQHTDRADLVLRKILLECSASQSASALHYALGHAAAPWRWSWWAMFLEEGRTPSRDSTHAFHVAESFTEELAPDA